MFKSKKTEQFNLIQLEREMERYLSMLIDRDMDPDIMRVHFLEQFPDEEQFFDEYVEDYYR